MFVKSCVIACVAVVLLAATTPVPHAGQAGRPGDDPYDHVMLGDRAVAGGKMVEARDHFVNALAFATASKKIIERLLRISANDPDARALWSHAWCAAAADIEGRVRPEKSAKNLRSPDDPHQQKIAFARARAVAELAGFAAERSRRGAQSPEELLVAQWARRFALDLARPAKALREAHEKKLEPRLVVSERFYKPVISALERELKTAVSNERTAAAIRMARCLHGLGVQAGFKDLEGPRPSGMQKVRRSAAAAMARAREQQRRNSGEPWTVAELEELTQEEGEAFTRDHDSFANPGVAVSPNGLYRIETDCGYETLLGVARTIEDHHNRLARLFRQDPFERKQGIVRIVPEAYGLESEGAPFWWAGGMQGGDTTTMRLSCGSIAGLGRGLTHELTHRFDGTIYPGMPGWLVEGRAVWTGGAYGSIYDDGFVPDHARFGTIEATYFKGYGGLKKLTELIECKQEDYRDNYVAGYALYVYLNTWKEDDRLIYADRLLDFMQTARSGIKSRKNHFVKHFADGKEGRPDGLEEFAKAFHTFIRGFHWKVRAEEKPPWIAWYTQKVPEGPPHQYVYDEPTWTWSRVRAEPFFGQDQAREAGRILLELGRREEGVRSLVWALSVDGPTPESEGLLADALKTMGRKDAAWVMRHCSAFPHEASGDSAPFLSALRQTRILLQALEEAAADYSSQEMPRTAAALTADRNRIAAWLGLERIKRPESSGRRAGEVKKAGRVGAAAGPEAAPEKTPLHPFDTGPIHARTNGWIEDKLTSYEEFRKENLWFATENGDLHMGRRKPRKGTGILDRAAHRNHAFARSDIWLLPGAYRIKTRIKFTTSYVSGAVIFGYTRRDYHLRLNFSAGDLMFAIGESEKEPTFEAVHFGVNGLRTRDGALPGSLCGGKFEFARPMPAFDLELLVDGATVQVFINGKWVGNYHTVDGVPIEGYVGVATSYGAVCAQRLFVERLDRSRLAALPGRPVFGLDLRNPNSRRFAELANHPVSGVPRSVNGTVLLWIPMPWLGGGDELDPEWVVSRAVTAAGRTRAFLDRELAPQPMAVIVPEALGEKHLRDLGQRLARDIEPPPVVHTHSFSGWIPEDKNSPDDWSRWVVFLDNLNIARVVMEYGGLDEEGSVGRLRHWLTVFRDHGRPQRVLPEYERADTGDGETTPEEESFFRR